MIASSPKIPTGLYFGSFNPVHIGHMAIANFMVEYTGLRELWFVVSPHNPLKEKKTLLDDRQRLHMVHLAMDDDPRFRASDIEFRLPTPSYTIDTLAYLEEKHPNREFQLVMGADQLKHFHKWKHAGLIVEKYHRLIYPRPGVAAHLLASIPNATLVQAPLMEISSSFIRQGIADGKDLRHLIPPPAYNYLREMRFYE